MFPTPTALPASPSPRAGPQALLVAPPDGWRMALEDGVSADSETCDLRGVQGNSECHFRLHPPSATARRPGDKSWSLLPGAAGPGPARRGPSSVAGSCGPRGPHTVVGKSRTTGSHYLTSVSSTIAKNGGRRAAVDLGGGGLCWERDGQLARSRVVQAWAPLHSLDKVLVWVPLPLSPCAAPGQGERDTPGQLHPPALGEP